MLVGRHFAYLISFVFLSAILLVGCGVQSERFTDDLKITSSRSVREAFELDKGRTTSPTIGGYSAFHGKEVSYSSQDRQTVDLDGDGIAEISRVVNQDAATDIPRKIIYNVALDLIVENFDDIRSKVESLVKQSQGAYISNSSNSGQSGDRRQGQWIIRVPQGSYEDLVEEFRKLGDVTGENKNSQDITDQFYDLESRLKNKRTTEARLLKFLDEKTGKLKDVLEVENQLDRVRGEVETMQGQLNRMAVLSSLTTVTLSIQEIKNYQPAVAIGFGTRAANSLSESVGALVEFGQGVVLLAVSVAPWLPIILLVLFVVRWILRRMSGWTHGRLKKPATVAQSI